MTIVLEIVAHRYRIRLHNNSKVVYKHLRKYYAVQK